MSLPDFRRLLGGLTTSSRFLSAWSRAPKRLHDPDDIAAITAKARR